MRILHITDSHLSKDSNATLHGLSAHKCLLSVLSHSKHARDVGQDHWPPVLILATGDLSHDASIESYHHLLTIFRQLSDLPVYCLAGNHDESMFMAEHLVSGNVSMQRHIIIGGWQILMLDSSVRDQVGGRLDSGQLDFLNGSLTENPDKHTLICLHHQPINMESAWLDEVGLDNKQEFHSIISDHPQVRGILWGHVHQQRTDIINDIMYMSTPSTCFQFKPRVNEHQYDELAPGYRWLECLDDGSIETWVERITDDEYARLSRK